MYVKAGLQYDAAPCVAFVGETRNFDFLVIRHKNVMQRNARIESESILASRCVGTSVDAKVTQRNTWRSVIL